jgi:hypothetical protein
VTRIVGEHSQSDMTGENRSVRPLLLLDDELYDDADERPRARPAPTLLVGTRASIGLTCDDADRLLAFARRVQTA